ncbi:unnamed protein product [Allacma fusca]|uniref:Uncharacterized protein n=1 Tax=Allacma fusca TaxID=39272 RepID=A0A8J2KC50_9HEXA|nr:unnamed protein product [Allacma fusca]
MPELSVKSYIPGISAGQRVEVESALSVQDNQGNTAVVRPVIEYAIVFWDTTLSVATCINKLNTLQRCTEIMITGGLYNTICTDVYSLTGPLPLWLHIDGLSIMARQRLKKNGHWSRQELNRDLFLDHLEDILVYTDDFKADGSADYGVAIKDILDDVWWAYTPLGRDRLYIKVWYDTIEAACIMVEKEVKDRNIYIYSDSMSMLTSLPDAGHSGNELVDELARKYAMSNNVPKAFGTEPIVPIANGVVREQVKKGLVKRLQEIWRNSKVKYLEEY